MILRIEAGSWPRQPTGKVTERSIRKRAGCHRFGTDSSEVRGRLCEHGRFISIPWRGPLATPPATGGRDRLLKNSGAGRRRLSPHRPRDPSCDTARPVSSGFAASPGLEDIGRQAHLFKSADRLVNLALPLQRAGKSILVPQRPARGSHLINGFLKASASQEQPSVDKAVHVNLTLPAAHFLAVPISPSHSASITSTPAPEAVGPIVEICLNCSFPAFRTPAAYATRRRHSWRSTSLLDM
jgi:hypothetical protein